MPSSAPAPSAGHLGRVRAASAWLWRVLCWVVLLTLGAVLTVAVVVPRVTGSTTYTVLSSSMEPAHPVGSLIVVRPRPVEAIRLGDVITYQLRSGEPTTVTHRVVASRVLDGERAFLTQGDANTRPDAALVRAVQVRGTVWYSVPHLGHLNSLLSGSQRALLAQLVALGLVVYAVVMFGGALRGRLRARPQPRRAAGGGGPS
ncbi:signal peptidase I [Desertihabitans brevis]|uniref:Signal peptidase I n=1 Tax=Desertihabitans brevis TaxID=2268447 RepID=A0A367YSD1_9ACTN|nr:signal peptidase I [Desertihabitans brevis]RCK68728.1 signal peptidase I [Desertihabitans brevis]